MATLTCYWAHNQTGGTGVGAADGLDGDTLVDQDGVIVIEDDAVNFYSVDDDGGASESEDAPYIIVPDTNPGNIILRNVGPQFVAHMVRATTDQTISDDTETKIQLNSRPVSRSFGGTNECDISSNYRWTCLQAGVYILLAQFQITSMADGTRFDTTIKVNGSVAAQTKTYQGGAGGVWNQVHYVASFSVNDYAELYVRHDSGGNEDIQQDDTWLRVVRIC